MPRYIDADALIKKLFPYDVVDKRCYSINAEAVYKGIETTPTADVAPSSEVAREIFTEIEFDINNLDFDREETRAIAIEGIIANAKKRFTEEQQ